MICFVKCFYNVSGRSQAECRNSIAHDALLYGKYAGIHDGIHVVDCHDFSVTNVYQYHYAWQMPLSRWMGDKSLVRQMDRASAKQWQCCLQILQTKV